MAKSVFMYKYALTYWEDYDQTTHHEVGITVGETMMEALERLSSLYGPDFDDLSIEMFHAECEQGLYTQEAFDELAEWRKALTEWQQVHKGVKHEEN